MPEDESGRLPANIPWPCHSPHTITFRGPEDNNNPYGPKGSDQLADYGVIGTHDQCDGKIYHIRRNGVSSLLFCKPMPHCLAGGEQGGCGERVLLPAHVETYQDLIDLAKKSEGGWQQHTDN